MTRLAQRSRLPLCGGLTATTTVFAAMLCLMMLQLQLVSAQSEVTIQVSRDATARDVVACGVGGATPDCASIKYATENRSVSFLPSVNVTIAVRAGEYLEHDIQLDARPSLAWVGVGSHATVLNCATQGRAASAVATLSAFAVSGFSFVNCVTPPGALDGGAMLFGAVQSGLSVVGCDFLNNTARRNGGAVAVWAARKCWFKIRALWETWLEARAAGCCFCSRRWKWSVGSLSITPLPAPPGWA